MLEIIKKFQGTMNTQLRITFTSSEEGGGLNRKDNTLGT